MAVVMRCVALAGLLATANAFNSPNIVMMLADDIGWSDLGYLTADLVEATPNIDNLAAQGVKINCIYGGIACSPGRAALLSGRYPMRYGMQKGAIDQEQRKGIFVNNSLMSDELQKVGYATAAVGKWHVGHAAWSQTPLQRGFDTFYGFMCTGQIDFLSKTQDGYLDLYNDAAPETDEYALSEDVRTSWLYDAHAEDFIRTHAAKGNNQPFFLYWALQDPHTPLSSPDYFLESEPCVDVEDETRQVYCGMLRCIDTSVEALMVALSESGYYNNTLIVFAGDNGGAPKNGGYNWPLRGSKGTLFQGGIRQASWAWGGMLSDSVRGTTYYDPLHLVDMFPTFLSIATAGHWQHTGDYALDGVDVRSAILEGGTSPRAQNDMPTLLNIIDDAGGVRIGQFSMLYNVKGDGWYPQPDMLTGEKKYIYNETQLRADCVSVTRDNVTGVLGGDGCSYLFDVVNDPTEETNLIDTYPDLAASMLTVLEQYAAEAVSYDLDSDKEEEAEDQAESTGYWGPWLDDSKITGFASSKGAKEKAAAKPAKH